MSILSGCTRLRFFSHINHACYAATHGYRYRFDLTPRAVDSVFDHKRSTAYWTVLSTTLDTPFSELGLSFDDRKLLIFPKSPVNPSGGWTYLSVGNFFFRSTRETHAFFRDVLNTGLSPVKEWWDERTYGMFTGGDQDKIIWNLILNEGIRERTASSPTRYSIPRRIISRRRRISSCSGSRYPAYPRKKPYGSSRRGSISRTMPCCRVV